MLTLRTQYYKSQIRFFGRILVALILTVAQCGTMVYNLFQGLFWFLLPVSLVICNDIMAYVFGITLGKTRLVKVSPKKTWEGFIGALFCTMLWSFIVCFIAHWCPLTCFTSSSICFLSLSGWSVRRPI